VIADEPSQSSGEQLELKDELDAHEGFDGWSIFDEARAQPGEEAETE
jgi:hypothetical protein